MKTRLIVLTTALGFVLTLGFLILVKTSAVAAPDVSGAVLCVRPGGGGGCYATIQAAVDAAADGSTIRVALGEYHEQVKVRKSLVLQGGWDTTFSTWDSLTNRTVIDADGLGSGVYIKGSSTPITTTIEGFFITDGNASSYLGWGGGILAEGDWSEPGFVTIRSNIIYGNVACNLDSCQGYGGGILIYSNRAIIEDNLVQKNIARSAGSGSGRGGGIAVLGYPVQAQLNRNTIIGNTAIFSTTGSYSTGQGGGLWSDSISAFTATGNVISENVAAEKGPGYGGGVFATGDFFSNEIITNTASVDGAGYGGGMYAYHMPNFHDNLVSGNIASQTSVGIGGGIYAVYLKDASGNTIKDNRATNGGGVFYQEQHGRQTFHGNLVTRNIADGMDAAVPHGGGGISCQADQVEITNNQILTNTGLAGGGILLKAGEKLLLQDNLIRANLSAAGGGLYMQDANGEVVHNRINGNGAFWWGGGIFLYGSSSPKLDRNIIMYNAAQGYNGFASGGVAVSVSPSTHVTMTNSLIARNTINSEVASGVHCVTGSCSLIHCTIADNTLGSVPGEGVRISAAGSTNQVWNSIIVGQSTGVMIDGSPVVELDYNDYYDNAVNVTAGISPGTHSLFVAPHFVNRAMGDYHLSKISPLINAGDASLTLPYDFEGQMRLSLPDIGVDEFIFGIYLPLMIHEREGIPDS